MFWFLGRKACGVLAARPGIKPAPPALEGAVLTTGPPVRSQGGDFHSHGLTVVVKVLVTQLCLPFCDPWTAAHQAPLSFGFSKQKYWSRLPFSSLGALPDPGIEPTSPVSLALQADSLSTEPSGK